MASIVSWIVVVLVNRILSDRLVNWPPVMSVTTHKSEWCPIHSPIHCFVMHTCMILPVPHKILCYNYYCSFTLVYFWYHLATHPNCNQMLDQGRWKGYPMHPPSFLLFALTDDSIYLEKKLNLFKDVANFCDNMSRNGMSILCWIFNLLFHFCFVLFVKVLTMIWKSFFLIVINFKNI